MVTAALVAPLQSSQSLGLGRGLRPGTSRAQKLDFLQSYAAGRVGGDGLHEAARQPQLPSEDTLHFITPILTGG